jgi:hypothetical protein
MLLKHYADAGEVLRDGAHFCWVQRVTLVSEDPIRGVWQLLFHPGPEPP